jgi:calcineurin-like phosphoesterase family protein
MTIWFTSDNHFSHFNIIGYTNRPFVTAGEMDKALIANHNSVVGPNDSVYFLGDFSFASPARTVEILNQLTGKHLYLINGNHDKVVRKSPEVADCFDWVKDYYELTIQDASISSGKVLFCLFHYPIMSWNGMLHNSCHLFGHTHIKENVFNGKKLMNIGVDANNYTPVSYEQIRDYFALVA